MFPTLTASATPAVLLAKAEKKNDLDDIYILPRSSHATCLAEYEKFDKNLDDKLTLLKHLGFENKVDINIIDQIMSKRYFGSSSLGERLENTFLRQEYMGRIRNESLKAAKDFLKDCGHTLPVDMRISIESKVESLKSSLEIEPKEAAVLERARKRTGLAQDILKLINGILAPWPESTQRGRFAPPVKIFE